MEHKELSPNKSKAYAGFKGFHDDKNLILDEIISTEERDDGGDIMLSDGMIERGQIVVLYQHGQDPTIGTRPIGKPLGFRKEVINGVKCIIARMQYYDGAQLDPPDNLGRLLYDMDKQGFLPNNSIGYTAIDQIPDAQGRTVTKWTLHEFSKVNVGMNAGCITMASKGEKVEFKYLNKPTSSSVADRFEKLQTSQKENKDMSNLENSDEHIAHKACKVLHDALIKDLKASAIDGVDAEKTASGCLKEYGEMALPHVEKYLAAVKVKKVAEEKDDEGESNEKNLAAVGSKIAHKSLKMAQKAMIEEIHSFAGKPDTDHVAEAKRIVDEHEKVALPHAKDFVAKFAEEKAKKTFGNIDTKSIAANIAHETARTNMDIIHNGMQNETYQKAWEDKETDSNEIASQIAGEAAELHKPHIKAIIDKVRADNPKDIGEYQKKHFEQTVTNPAGTEIVQDALTDTQPVNLLLKEFQTQPVSAEKTLDIVGIMAELKDLIPTMVSETVTAEIRKASGKID